MKMDSQRSLDLKVTEQILPSVCSAILFTILILETGKTFRRKVEFTTNILTKRHIACQSNFTYVNVWLYFCVIPACFYTQSHLKLTYLVHLDNLVPVNRKPINASGKQLDVASLIC